MSPSAARALSALCSLAEPSGRVVAGSRQALLDLSGVSLGSWDRVVKELQALGLVATKPRTGPRSRLGAYEVTPEGLRRGASESHRATDRATPSHTSDLLLSSSNQKTKEESLEEPREGRATGEPQTESQDLARAVWALVAAFERIATALEARPASEPKAAVSEERPEPETKTQSGDPRCSCGPMIVWPNKATGEQFWGCAKGPKERGGCGAPTVLLRGSAAAASRPRCPDCSGPMHLNRPGDRVTFWGCDRYPVCKGKVPLHAASPVLPCEVREPRVMPSPTKEPRDQSQLSLADVLRRTAEAGRA